MNEQVRKHLLALQMFPIPNAIPHQVRHGPQISPLGLLVAGPEERQVSDERAQLIVSVDLGLLVGGPFVGVHLGIDSGQAGEVGDGPGVVGLGVPPLSVGVEGEGGVEGPGRGFLQQPEGGPGGAPQQGGQGYGPLALAPPLEEGREPRHLLVEGRLHAGFGGYAIAVAAPPPPLEAHRRARADHRL